MQPLEPGLTSQVESGEEGLGSTDSRKAEHIFEREMYKKVNELGSKNHQVGSYVIGPR